MPDNNYFNELPENLPEPVDDGLANHCLVNRFPQ